MIKGFFLRLLLATTFLLTISMPALAQAEAAVDRRPASNGAQASASMAGGGTAGDPTFVAQITATPAPYPSPGGEVAPTASVAPGEVTPSPASGYPAGGNVDGTDRVGGSDRPIPGTDSGNDEAAAGAQIEQSGLGSFILWLGFIFGFVVFIAGIFFSIFLSTRDRRSEL